MGIQHLPVEQISNTGLLYETLGLEGFVAARPCFEAHLGKVRDHRATRHPLPTEAALQVRQRWAPFIERLRYAADELDRG